jgi:hypothetical protein
MLFQLQCPDYLLSYQTDFTFWLSPKSKQKTQGGMKNNNLHLQNPTKWGDFRAQLSTSPFYMGFAALRRSFLMKPEFKIASVGVEGIVRKKRKRKLSENQMHYSSHPIRSY